MLAIGERRQRASGVATRCEAPPGARELTAAARAGANGGERGKAIDTVPFKSESKRSSSQIRGLAEPLFNLNAPSFPPFPPDGRRGRQLAMDADRVSERGSASCGGGLSATTHSLSTMSSAPLLSPGRGRPASSRHAPAAAADGSGASEVGRVPHQSPKAAFPELPFGVRHRSPPTVYFPLLPPPPLPRTPGRPRAHVGRRPPAPGQRVRGRRRRPVGLGRQRRQHAAVHRGKGGAVAAVRFTNQQLAPVMRFLNGACQGGSPVSDIHA